MTIFSIFLVGCGGAIGAFLRFYFSKKWNKETLPWGTLTVNLTGSMLLGILVGAAIPEQWMLLAGTGLMGALTTFSTFQVESLNLLRGKERRRYVLYQGASYAGGLTLAFAGLLLGRFLS
ncbi:fluoride efflux transporter FluC [Salimicrobium halophilum]|uniref:Fluoride-specific ion channel FluC n=1 Tax=Salimicrobium halophilum TaxID=86666 RepID=A0A1G8REP7_9BACI|nr:CrcB family protein [Salimicrobium halophilum]SDJ15448.1 camphor resistance protein CrcB [Salimicrobium halophilum]